MSELNPQRCLPKQWAASGIEDIFYEIGFSLSSVKHRPQRSLIHNPLLICLIVTIQLLERIGVLYAKDSDQLTLQILGDIGAYFGIRIHLSLLISLLCLMVLLIQATYLMNFVQKSRPVHLALLQMVSSYIPPSQMGLENNQDIMSLVKLSRFMIVMKKVNIYFVILSSSAFEFIPYLLHANIWVTLSYGVVNTIIMILSNYHIYNVISFHALYFYIVCKFFIMKVKNLNKNLKELAKNDDLFRIRPILRTLSSLYSEIDSMNSIFWSKFLFNVWLTFGSVIVILIYIGAFGSLELYMAIIIDYVIFSFSLFFVFIFIMAASVNSQINKTYPILHILTSNNCVPKIHPLGLSASIKVNNFSIILKLSMPDFI